jgi:hypothetical protein
MPASMTTKAAMPEELYKINEYITQETSLIWLSNGTTGSTLGNTGEFKAEAEAAKTHNDKRLKTKRELIFIVIQSIVRQVSVH